MLRLPIRLRGPSRWRQSGNTYHRDGQSGRNSPFSREEPWPIMTLMGTEVRVDEKIDDQSGRSGMCIRYCQRGVLVVLGLLFILPPRDAGTCVFKQGSDPGFAKSQVAEKQTSKYGIVSEAVISC